RGLQNCRLSTGIRSIGSLLPRRSLSQRSSTRPTDGCPPIQSWSGQSGRGSHGLSPLAVSPLRLAPLGEGFGAFDVVLAGEVGFGRRVGGGHRRGEARVGLAAV